MQVAYAVVQKLCTTPFNSVHALLWQCSNSIKSLKMYPYKVCIVQQLLSRDNYKHNIYCQWCMTFFNSDRQKLDKWCWSDGWSMVLPSQISDCSKFVPRKTLNWCINCPSTHRNLVFNIQCQTVTSS